jgi:hypothetical protein
MRVMEVTSHHGGVFAPVFLAVSLAFVACGDSADDAASTTSAPSSTSTTSEPVGRTEVRAYFLRDEMVGPVAREAVGKATAAGAVLGGEGLLLEKPQRRADWEDLSPAILVESPLPLATVTSPLRIVGTANTFEAMFRIKVTDGAGRIVYDHSAMATSGTGTRGTFDVNADFEVPRPGLGSVIAFADSPRDGTPIHVVEIPIHLSK